MVLEAVYEQDFVDCSYGFRPGRSAHDALAELQHRAVRMDGGWVLEVDIRAFFDTVDRACLRELLCQRVRDGVLLRLIGKWLNAGVQEGGVLSYPAAGTPQGGVASPLLANIYLHEVLDTWFEREVKPRLRGQAVEIRYADDLVFLFSDEADARRVMDVLPKRLGKYGLTLHPDKTRLLDFRRPTHRDDGGPGPGTFDLLGFTHYWGKSRRRFWVVKQKTAKDRRSRSLRSIHHWCRSNCHRPVAEQHRILSWKLRGHYGYYGIIGNAQWLWTFLSQVQRAWRKWLNRRSQRAHMPWERMKRLLERYPLPSPSSVRRRLPA